MPKGDAPGESLYGWAGWNRVQRVQAIAGTYIDAESRQGWPVPQLIPSLAAVHEELPWVLQWHNQIDSELGLKLDDYFHAWLGTELKRHGLDAGAPGTVVARVDYARTPSAPGRSGR